MAAAGEFKTVDGGVIKFQVDREDGKIIGNFLSEQAAKFAKKVEDDTLTKLRKDPFIDWGPDKHPGRPATTDGLPIPGDEPLVVGRWYAVPTVNNKPVIDSPHTDSDNFNHTPEHYHLDSRFVDYVTCGTEIVYARGLFTFAKGELETADTKKKPVYMAYKCVRALPVEWSEAQDMLDKAGMILASTYAAIAHKTLICGKCPHRGMPVQGGICTGHRTRWKSDGTCEYKAPFYCRLEQTGDTSIIQPANIQIKLSGPFRGFPELTVYDAEGRDVLKCKLKSYYDGREGEYFVMKDNFFGIREEPVADDVEVLP